MGGQRDDPENYTDVIGDDRVNQLMKEEKLIAELIANAKARASKTTTPSSTGGKKTVKKMILGKLRCIYKILGSRKEYVKHKGVLITVTDYKKLMNRK